MSEEAQLRILTLCLVLGYLAGSIAGYFNWHNLRRDSGFLGALVLGGLLGFFYVFAGAVITGALFKGTLFVLGIK